MQGSISRAIFIGIFVLGLSGGSWAKDFSCISNVKEKVEQITTQAHDLGVWLGGGFPYNHYSSVYTKMKSGKIVRVAGYTHIQGIQRLYPQGGRYFAISGSDEADVWIAEIESAHGGGPIRSNLQAHNGKPHDLDRVILRLKLAEDRDSGGWTHAGGMDAIENFLIVPIENDDKSVTFFFDVSNPKRPVKRYVLKRNHKAGTIAITKLPNGRYLMLISRNTATNVPALDSFVTRETSLRTDPGFEHQGTWKEEDLHGLDEKFGNYQALKLICDDLGQIWLLGLTKTTVGTVIGKNYLDLFKVDHDRGKITRITKVIKKELHPHRGVNFNAGGGFYIDNLDHILVYATEHYTKKNEPLSIAEFSNPTRPVNDLKDGFVELYDDKNYQDRSLKLRGNEILEPIPNYKKITVQGKYGFGDKVSSVRFALPRGFVYVLYEDHGFKGKELRLVGTGKEERYHNLRDKHFGDKVSSSKLTVGATRR